MILSLLNIDQNPALAQVKHNLRSLEMRGA